MATKPSTPNYRRADTGEFTTKAYADRHPKTTVAERRTPAPAPVPKKK